MNTINQCIKVSIIIPVYNASKYLQDCLESVCNQTLKEIEIICINDGSTDCSIDIINKFIENDGRILVLNRSNKGAGISRNEAISYATGEYIGFVDSDDWVELTMFEELYNHSKSLDSDLTICEFKIVDFDKGNQNKPEWAFLPIDDGFQNTYFTWKNIKDDFFKITVAPWNKLYKKDLINRINAQFGLYRALEDYQFSLTCLLNASKITILKKDLYFYRLGVPESLSSNQNIRNPFNYFEVIKFYRQKFITDSNFKDAELQIISTIINNCLNNLNNIHFSLKEEYYYRIKKELKSLYFENNPYLDKTTIKNARLIKNGTYLSSKYFDVSTDPKSFSKQQILNYLQKSLIRKFEQVKKWFTH